MSRPTATAERARQLSDPGESQTYGGVLGLTSNSHSDLNRRDFLSGDARDITV